MTFSGFDGSVSIKIAMVIFSCGGVWGYTGGVLWSAGKNSNTGKHNSTRAQQCSHLDTPNNKDINTNQYLHKYYREQLHKINNEAQQP